MRIIVSCCLIFFPILFLYQQSIKGMDRRLLFQQARDHYVKHIGPDIKINWTAGFISARASVRLPRIIFNSNHPDFGKPGTVRSISNARARAREYAREKASQLLLHSLGQIRFNASFTLLEMMKKKRKLRDRLGELPSRFLVRSRHTGEGFVSVELALPFFSDKGLYSLITDERYGRSPLPEATDLPLEDQITGLIVDLRMYSNFNPALEFRMFSDQGKRVYGPEVVKRGCAIKRGLASYYLSREKALRDRTLGRSPYYTVASGIIGNGKSDIILNSNDVMRILGSKSGRRVFRRCAVAIILKKPTPGKVLY